MVGLCERRNEEEMYVCVGMGGSHKLPGLSLATG